MPKETIGDWEYERLKDPDLFDKRSFRTISPDKSTHITIGCPKGKWKKGRCAVGTQAQRIARKNPPASLYNKRHEIYDQVLCIEMHTPVGLIRMEVEGPVKIYGLEGGKLDGQLVFIGRGLADIVLSGEETLKAVEARKGKKSLWPEELFRHDFDTEPGITKLNKAMWLIRGSMKLHKNFQY